jgi:rSAM/selenodomain-associated transferase 1
MTPIVYVFARAPRLGTVKRRLAAGIGAVAALRTYRAMLDTTLRRLGGDRRFRTVVAITPDRARGPWRQGLPTAAQGFGDLGRRLQRIANRHRTGHVAIVGSDIAGLRADDVALAFRALRRASACFGPAEDGGYWLVALGPRRPSRPFADVRWSSATALTDTLRNFAGRRVELLRTLRDVDTAADLAAVAIGRRSRADRHSRLLPPEVHQ